MAKDQRIQLRVPVAVKNDLEAAARRDGMTLSAWLRWLGEERGKETAGVEPAETTRDGAPEPVAAFVPGAGLGEEA